MSYRFFLIAFLFFGFVLHLVTLHAQNNISNNSNQKETSSQSRLFDDDDILHFKLEGKLNELFNDRNDNAVYHPMLLQYMRKDSSFNSLQIMVKTRGHFRRLKGNCKMPPLLLNLSKAEKIKNSIFDKQNKLKLVVPCQGDEYVIKEWLVYKLYNIITEKSFKAKLVQVDFEDSSMKRKPESHYCILLEDEKKVAERNKAFVWNKKLVAMRNTNGDEFKKLTVFEYMIGNTDWSVPYLQNIVLITKDSTKAAIAIPYDFDHAGIVEAPYADAAAELEIASTRERLYRGYCESDRKNFAETFELFNRHKNDIYDVYSNCTLLKPKYVKSTLSYLDDFYKIINNDKAIADQFEKPCRTSTRIEIKGLKD
ncbi:MAG: hypothetical protein ABI834_01750 [Ginsengibacter sp.]